MGRSPLHLHYTTFNAMRKYLSEILFTITSILYLLNTDFENLTPIKYFTLSLMTICIILMIINIVIKRKG